MNKSRVVLVPLNEDDREQFIKDNQWAFKYGIIILLIFFYQLCQKRIIWEISLSFQMLLHQ